MAHETWTVIYRQGGTKRYRWVRTLDVETEENAQSHVVGLEKMGYRALKVKTAQLETLGMPEGWDADDRRPTELRTDGVQLGAAVPA
jgi:hypothetical protein